MEPPRRRRRPEQARGGTPGAPAPTAAMTPSRVPEPALQRQPQLRGTVTVRFLIQDDGHVSEATVISTTAPDGDLDACITGAVRTFRFTPPDGGGQVSVTYPFTLDSD